MRSLVGIVLGTIAFMALDSWADVAFAYHFEAWRDDPTWRAPNYTSRYYSRPIIYVRMTQRATHHQWTGRQFKKLKE